LNKRPVFYLQNNFNLNFQLENRKFGLMGQQTWSGEDYECNSERDLHMINKLRPVESDSLFSSNSSSMTSSIGSSASQNTTRRRRAIERDQNADISKFNVRVAGVYLVLLHDDILLATTKLDESPLNVSSVKKLHKKCEFFFAKVCEGIESTSTSDLGKIGDLLKTSCDNNHLQLMLAPIIVEGEERRTTKGNCTKLTFSVSRADIHENLGELSLPILEFSRKDSTADIAPRPEVSISMEKTFYVIRSSSGKQFIAPRLNLGVTLSTAKFDFDVSMFDRLHALFSSPFASFLSNGDCNIEVNNLPPSSQKIVQQKTKIKIQSECLSLVLRFPIVDLRPLHDPEKQPWWHRNVRTDYLIAKLSEFQLNYISPSTYDVIAHEILLSYHENEKATPITIGKASLYESNSGKYYTTSPDYPRIVIQLPSDQQIKEMNEAFIQEQNDGRNEDTDSDPTSGESIKINPTKEKEETPFSAKKVCRESDTPHGKVDDGKANNFCFFFFSFINFSLLSDESETLLIPGDREEINRFCDNAMKFSKLQIKVDLPVVSVQLKSKHLYEVIYNRIISDILMWESSVPKAKPEVVVTLKKPPDSLMNAGMMDSIYAPFAMCKSNINFDSNSSATNSESEGDDAQVYYSIHKKKKNSLMFFKDHSNATSFRLHIGQGIVTMYAPVRDSGNHVIPGQLGEFVVRVNATDIFTVNGFHGNSNLGYFCIQSSALEMFHCGLLPVPIQNPPIRDFSCSLPTWLKSTLYPTPRNLTLADSRGSSKRDFVSLAMQIKANPEQGLKRTKLSVGVQVATLRHNATLPEHLWLTQLMDMFDVRDDIVPGYTPYTNLTEFHLHLWDCAVDYRPVHYPFRAVVTIGTFMISSNIATGSVGCTLRFVAEDAALCLAPWDAENVSEVMAETNKITALPSSELICVAELGLFEISLRLNEKVTALSPKYDLRAAIKDVHLRTCSDSGQALLDLVSYVAADGDLDIVDEEDDTKSEASSMQYQEDAELLPMRNPETAPPEVTQTQQQHVNSLMADAMEESIFVTKESPDEIVDLGTDVFFFPDEQSKKGATKKTDRFKRRCASEDSISIDSSSYKEDEEIFVRRFEAREEDSGSVNTEMRELLDFETSVMMNLKEEFDPQVEMDLGRETPPKKPQQSSRKLSSDSDDDFCIVADEERPSYGEVPVVQTDDPIRIIDNHFSAPHGKPDLLQAPADFPMAVQRYTLCEATLVWHMYGGHDFASDDDKKKEKEERDEM
jgi:autophagy-related protein 2